MFDRVLNTALSSMLKQHIQRQAERLYSNTHDRQLETKTWKRHLLTGYKLSTLFEIKFSSGAGSLFRTICQLKK